MNPLVKKPLHFHIPFFNNLFIVKKRHYRNINLDLLILHLYTISKHLYIQYQITYIQYQNTFSRFLLSKPKKEQANKSVPEKFEPKKS